MSGAAPTTEATVAALLAMFFRAVSFEAGGRPRYDELPDLFIPEAKLIRAVGPAPEISDVPGFVRTRRSAVDAGELTSFDESELAARTELFGNVAHRFSAYAKRGTTSRGPFEGRGVISTQFVRCGDAWRIASMTWDDEREALVLPAWAAPGPPD